MVARVVLLLAMDKYAMGEKGISECKITGQLISVQEFLNELGVEKKTLKKKGMAKSDRATTTALYDWYLRWDGWQIGFTHCVQLKLPPNEDTVWYLLGHRAAGLFPRNQKGAGLLIPIFRKEKVLVGLTVEWKTEASVILVQVKNRYPSDNEFSKSAANQLCPSFVFGKKKKREKKEDPEDGNIPVVNPPKETLPASPLSKEPFRDVIRIYKKKTTRTID
ncbi:uncharacterized protein KRP23_1564 [Phytophthora ramorum]|uniref:uncharacterized protein n=1 Tax=Phytophthora ramorum TaxID=164328 RepID=UPI0030AA13B2|nr:hypothetical protein KRP23_1564 [Phytophthora ramorum]